jgi:hypothetical protein
MMDTHDIERLEKVSEYSKVIENISNNRHMFIMLFMPGCHPCRAAMPEWVKLPKTYKDADVLRVGEYDLEKLQSGIEPRLDVQGFPTFVHLFKNNQPEYYSGERNVDGFTDWMDSIINKSITGGKRKRVRKYTRRKKYVGRSKTKKQKMKSKKRKRTYKRRKIKSKF